MKYIVFSVELAGIKREMPVIFGNDLSHCDVAAGMQALCPELEHAKLVSAGECSSLDLHPSCHGHSFTLGIKSRPQRDSKLITTLDYTHGMEF